MNVRPLILTFTIMLSACGFQALHGQEYRSSLSVDLSSITIDVTPNSVSNNAINSGSTVPRRFGELLKAEIKDRVNPTSVAAEKLYHLDIFYTETDVSLFVRPDGTASRGNLVYGSNYTITRMADQKLVASGSVSTTSSYNTSPSADYASYVSIQDARKRAVLDLAQTYKMRLAALLPTLNNPTGTAIEKKPEGNPVLQPVRGYENSTTGY